MPEENDNRAVVRSPARPGTLQALLEQDSRSALSSIRAMAVSNGHFDPVPTVREDTMVAAPARGQGIKAPSPQVGGEYRRGQVVRHKPTGRKVTVLAVSVSGCEVVDGKSGRRWLCRSVDLQAL